MLFIKYNRKNSIIANTDVINTHTIIGAINLLKKIKLLLLTENKFRNYDKVLPDVIKCYAGQRIFQNLDYYDYAIVNIVLLKKNLPFGNYLIILKYLLI